MNYIIPIGIILFILLVLFCAIIYGISRGKQDDYNDYT